MTPRRLPARDDRSFAQIAPLLAPDVSLVRRSAADESALRGVAAPQSDEQSTDYANIVVPKPWGNEYLLFESDDVAVWILHIRYSQETSLHCHLAKLTSLVVLDGRVRCSSLDHTWERAPMQGLTFDSGAFHQTHAISSEGAWVMEVETPINKRDLVRLSDRYGRARTKYDLPGGPYKDNEVCINLDARRSHERSFGRTTLTFLRLGPAAPLEPSGADAGPELVCILRGALSDPHGGALRAAPGLMLAGSSFRDALAHWAKPDLDIVRVSLGRG